MNAKQRTIVPVVAALVLSLFAGGFFFPMRTGTASERGAAVEVKQITVEHLHFASHNGFDQVSEAFLAQLGREPGFSKSLAEGIDAERLRAKLKAAEGPSGFMLFTSYNHGELLRLAGQKRRAVQYVVGNPLFALEMTQHEIRDCLYAPLRVLIYEDENGQTCVEYDKPSTLFGQFGNAKATAEAKMLDRKLAALVAKSIE